MKRILLMVFRNIILVPIMAEQTMLLRIPCGQIYTEEQRYAMLKFIVLRANKGGNVTIDVHGRENIPDKDGFMFSNHQGLYDVLAILEACPRPFFSVVAKERKLPISSS